MIELLVVIAIIGILAAVVLVNIWGSTAKARDARRVADIGAIAKALHLYQLETGTLPGNGAGQLIGDNSGPIDSILADYMSEVPQDPLSGTSGYVYLYDSAVNCLPIAGQEAVVWASTMEDPLNENGEDVCAYAYFNSVYIVLLSH